MFKYRILSLAMCFILLFSLIGCKSKTDKAYLYFELPEIPSTVDPQTAKTDAELIIVKNIFEGLMRKDNEGKTVLGAAESMNKDGLTYTFTLRDGITWDNDTAVTADDFVFGIKRALDPDTKSPFVSRLFSIKNAKSVNSGNTSAENLGVTAIDDKTVKFTLEYEDEKFLETLTTSVAMPCNEKFFKGSKGKYGLFRDNIISNGSYRLTKWNKESFGIRLYKNEDYNGGFEAKNAAVFLTCNPETPVTEKLSDGDIDIAFIETAERDNMEAKGFKTESAETTCWVMTFSDDLSLSMRTALLKLVGAEVYGDDLPVGYSPADSLFPNILNVNAEKSGIISYSLEEGKNLYASEIKSYPDKKFPANIVLKYYNNGYIKNTVTDIVGHWQSHLSAFINIEAVDSPDVLLSQLKEQTQSIAIFPVSADGDHLEEYLENFGITYNGENASQIQANLLKSKKMTPIVFEDTTVCYSPQIKEISVGAGNGFIDFSFVVKEEN